MTSVMKIYLLYLQTVLIAAGPGAQYRMQVKKISNMFTVNFMFSPSKANSWRFKKILNVYHAIEMSLNNTWTHGKFIGKLQMANLQSCQTLRGDMQITAETT